MMQERTNPYAAPGKGRMDDINIPVVALAVGLFALTVGALILFMEAAFRRADMREIAAKTLSQEDTSTPLGMLLARQRAELEEGPGAVRGSAAGGTTTAAGTAGSQPARLWIPIETAMELVAREYHGSRGS